MVAALGSVYAVVTALGFLSLKQPNDPIGDPYVSVMEGLIVAHGTDAGRLYGRGPRLRLP